MNDAALVTVIVHGVVATLLAVGGACCLIFGFKLLSKRKTTESKSTFEATVGKHKIAFTAGTAVVFVSTVWVAGSIVALPSFSQTEKGTTVAAAIPFQGSITELAAAQKELIDSIAPALTVGSAPLSIEGFADTGNEAMNSALAERRGEAVKNEASWFHDLDGWFVAARHPGMADALTSRVPRTFGCHVRHWPPANCTFFPEIQSGLALRPGWTFSASMAILFCMPRKARSLPSGDADFYRRAALAVFSNPFGDEFRAVIREIESECGARVAALEERGMSELRKYAGEERETMRMVLLFDAYQRFRPALDDLVVAQVAAGDSPVTARFSRDLLSLLQRRGFDADEALPSSFFAKSSNKKRYS